MPRTLAWLTTPVKIDSPPAATATRNERYTRGSADGVMTVLFSAKTTVLDSQISPTFNVPQSVLDAGRVRTWDVTSPIPGAMH